MRTRFLLLFILLVVSNGNVCAQKIDTLKNDIVESIALINYDSLKVQMSQGTDSIGVVKISESLLLSRIFSNQVVRDGLQEITISRISIFFDNSQNARADAIETMNKFKELFPGIVAEMSHENPYFKVNVGLCLSTDEALIMLNKLRVEFPKAFIVRERVSIEQLKNMLNPKPVSNEDETEMV